MYIFSVHGLLFFHGDRPPNVIWIGDRRKLLGRNLDRFAVEGRKTIETKLAALGKDPNENRKTGRRKRRAAIFPDVEPVHDLAVHLEQRRVCRRQETDDPRSGGDDDLFGVVVPRLVFTVTPELSRVSTETTVSLV